MVIVPLFLAAVYAGDLGHSAGLDGHGAIDAGLAHGAGLANAGLAHGAGLAGAGLANAALAGAALANNAGAAALAGAGLSEPQIINVSQIRGAPRISQQLTSGPTRTTVSQGPTIVTRQRVGFTPGTTTIRRDTETDTIHTQRRVDTIRTDKEIPKITTVQHNAIRPVDVTRAQTRNEITTSIKHIPRVSQTSHQQISTSQDTVVHQKAPIAIASGHEAQH